MTESTVWRRFDGVARLVEARPSTGRTHQSLVHCQFAGHPIIGDDKYGTDPVNREIKEYGIRRLFLHAAELRVPLPSGGRKIFHAPLGDELENGLKKLQKIDGQ